MVRVYQRGAEPASNVSTMRSASSATFGDLVEDPRVGARVAGTATT